MPMTSEHYTALGQVTVRYSHLEFTLSGFIWKLVALDQRVGQTITASLNFSGRVNLLRSLFSLLPPYGISADVDGLRDVLDRAEKASQKRNAVVHALAWTTEGSDFVHINLKPKKAAEWTNAPASVKELRAIADALTNAQEAISQFMLKHFEPYGADAWASPMGPGTLWGATLPASISWHSQFGGQK